METTRNAVIYARVSVSTDESVSIPRTIEAAQQYAASRGWNVVGKFIDDGVSATKNKPEDRPGWSALLESDEQFDTVIIWKIDRLARRITDFWATVEDLESRGVTLVSIEDHLDMSSTVGRILAGVLAGFAQMEAETTALRVRDARKHLLSVGRVPGGSIPYGWQTRPIEDGSKKGKVLEHDPERIDVVKAIVERAQRGETLYTIKRWLDEVEAPLPRVSTASRKSTSWSYSTLERLLRNPILAGMIPYNPGNQSKVRGDDVVRDENGLPRVNEDIAIMTVKDWRAMVARLDSRDSPQSRPRAMKANTSALLSGLVWCAECDSRMWRGTVQKRPAYSCPKCHQTISKLDPYVIEQFLYQKGDWHRWSVTEEVFEPGGEILPEIEQRLTELGAALQATDDDAEAETITEQMAGLRRLRREKRRERPKRTFQPTRTEYTFAEDWERAETVEEQREVLDDAIERVTVSRGRRGGRGLDVSRIEFAWKLPESLGPTVEPDDETLAALAE